MPEWALVWCDLLASWLRVCVAEVSERDSRAGGLALARPSWPVGFQFFILNRLSTSFGDQRPPGGLFVWTAISPPPGRLHPMEHSCRCASFSRGVLVSLRGPAC